MTSTARHSHRDSKGRFAPITHHVAEMAAESMPYHVAGDTSHSHAACPKAKGQALVTQPQAHGWLCCHCIEVESVLAGWMEMVVRENKAGHVVPAYSKSGTIECGTCHTVKRATAFPTGTDSGLAVRVSTRCRACRNEARKAA